MANKAVNKKKKGMNGEELAGMHIYKDDHNRYVTRIRQCLPEWSH